MTTQDEFFQQVRDGLNHLYDYPYLEDHPLALRCGPKVGRDGPNRAQRLYRLLLESIEELHPPAAPSKDTSRARSYSLLVYRYVEEWPLPDIMRELGYSRRQFFREQRKAIAMLAALLWEKLPRQELSRGELPREELPRQELPREELLQEELPREELLREELPREELPREGLPPQAPASAEPDDQLAVEAERFLSQREAVDPAGVVQGVLEIIGPLARQRGVTLACDLGQPLPPIPGNRMLLRQVFLSALSNLITQPGTQRVLLRMRYHRQRVVAELTAEPDTPGGRSSDGVDRRAPDLEHVRRLVQIVGGHWQGLEVRPEGCTCRFDFPADSEKVLLVIEDNEAVIRAFRRYLVAYNYQVVGATAGTEALQFAREMSPTVITLDVMLPSQDGWEILQALKNDPLTAHIPVIVCSVLEDPELAHSLGAAAYLRKPVAQADLLTMLGSLSADRNKV